jgi:hypothetical protein
MMLLMLRPLRLPWLLLPWLLLLIHPLLLLVRLSLQTSSSPNRGDGKFSRNYEASCQIWSASGLLLGHASGSQIFPA